MKPYLSRDTEVYFCLSTYKTEQGINPTAFQPMTHRSDFTDMLCTGTEGQSDSGYHSEKFAFFLVKLLVSISPAAAPHPQRDGDLIPPKVLRRC